MASYNSDFYDRSPSEDGDEIYGRKFDSFLESYEARSPNQRPVAWGPEKEPTSEVNRIEVMPASITTEEETTVTTTTTTTTMCSGKSAGLDYQGGTNSVTGNVDKAKSEAPDAGLKTPGNADHPKTSDKTLVALVDAADLDAHVIEHLNRNMLKRGKPKRKKKAGYTSSGQFINEDAILAEKACREYDKTCTILQSFSLATSIKGRQKAIFNKLETPLPPVRKPVVESRSPTFESQLWLNRAVMSGGSANGDIMLSPNTTYVTTDSISRKSSEEITSTVSTCPMLDEIPDQSTSHNDYSCNADPVQTTNEDISQNCYLSFDRMINITDTTDGDVDYVSEYNSEIKQINKASFLTNKADVGTNWPDSENMKIKRYVDSDTNGWKTIYDEVKSKLNKTSAKTVNRYDSMLYTNMCCKEDTTAYLCNPMLLPRIQTSRAPVSRVEASLGYDEPVGRAIVVLSASQSSIISSEELKKDQDHQVDKLLTDNCQMTYDETIYGTELDNVHKLVEDSYHNATVQMINNKYLELGGFHHNTKDSQANLLLGADETWQSDGSQEDDTIGEKLCPGNKIMENKINIEIIYDEQTNSNECKHTQSPTSIVDKTTINHLQQVSEIGDQRREINGAGTHTKQGLKERFKLSKIGQVIFKKPNDEAEYVKKDKKKSRIKALFSNFKPSDHNTPNKATCKCIDGEAGSKDHTDICKGKAIDSETDAYQKKNGIINYFRSSWLYKRISKAKPGTHNSDENIQDSKNKLQLHVVVKERELRVYKKRHKRTRKPLSNLF